MKYSPKILAAAAIIAGVSASTVGVSTTFAMHETKGGGPNDLITAIAQRFNLNEAEVKAVFEEHRALMAESMKAEADERLAIAVEDGRLTAEQAEAIKLKHEEHEAFRQSLKGMDETERKEAMKTHMEESKAWAEEQGIPLGSFIGEGMHRGPRGHRGISN